jgi:hypothetical protein
MADTRQPAAADLAYLAYLAKYQPQTFARWMHLVREHRDLARRPCGCDARTVAEPVIDMGYLSLPADVQASIEQGLAERRKGGSDGHGQ